MLTARGISADGPHAFWKISKRLVDHCTPQDPAKRGGARPNDAPRFNFFVEGRLPEEKNATVSAAISKIATRKYGLPCAVTLGFFMKSGSKQISEVEMRAHLRRNPANFAYRNKLDLQNNDQRCHDRRESLRSFRTKLGFFIKSDSKQVAR